MAAARRSVLFVLVALLCTPAMTAVAAPSSVERLAGADRFETAALIAQEAFPGGAETVFVASAATFADALAGAPLAASQQAPILLVTPDAVPDPTRRAIEQLRPRQILLLGGPVAVGDHVAATLGQMAPAGVQRIAGTTRYGTAAEVAKRWAPGVDVFVATGHDYPDALAAAAVAAGHGMPVLLTQRESIPDETRAALRRLSPGRIFVLGGLAAVSEGVEAALADLASGGAIRVAGNDRYETAGAIATGFYGRVDTVLVTTGADSADALAGAVLAGRRSAPLLLTTPDRLHDATATALTSLDPSTVLVLGGERAVGDAVLTAIRSGSSGNGPVPAAVLPASVFSAEPIRPVGLAVVGDAVWVTHDVGTSSAVTRFDPAGVPQGQVRFGGLVVGQIGRLARDPTNGLVWHLRSSGQLDLLDPTSDQLQENVVQLGGLTWDATAIYDVATGTVGTIAGTVQPNFADWGDIAVRGVEGGVQLFVTGQSQGFPFVGRVTIVGQQIVEARVVVGSRSSSAPFDNVPRGVAVNAQGHVLTTLPITPSSTGNLDVPVAFDAAIDPRRGGTAAILFGGGVFMSSRGVDVDQSGNFFVATGPAGVAGTGQSIGGGALVVIPSSLDRIAALGVLPDGLVQGFQDVAVDDGRRRALVTLDGAGVVAFSFG